MKAENNSARPVPSLATPAHQRYQSLDAWRGLACLMIVALHASFYVRYASLPEAALLENPVGSRFLLGVSRMGIGVQLFFVISGFCIAATADTSRRNGTGVGQYFVRRLRRIFPPYWAALIIATAGAVVARACGFPDLLVGAGGWIPHPDVLTWQQWVGNLTLTETWRQHVSSDPALLVLGPAWSLCYEEQFYLVCGILLLLVPRRFFVGVAVVTLATLGLSAVSFVHPMPNILYFFFDGQWLLFAVGVFVYYVLNYTTGARGRVLAGVLCIVTGVFTVLRYRLLANSSSELQDQAFELIVASAFGVVLLFLHRWDKVLSTNRCVRPLVFCGKMCYSLYLIHWPITKVISHVFFDMGLTGVWETLLVTIPVSIAASVSAAWGFHVVVESFFLNPPSMAAKSHRPLAAVAAPGGLVRRPAPVPVTANVQ
jgi:peptidoglycan/LPS O-acetylase OafA/YrhL